MTELLTKTKKKMSSFDNGLPINDDYCEADVLEEIRLSEIEDKRFKAVIVIRNGICNAYLYNQEQSLKIGNRQDFGLTNGQDVTGYVYEGEFIITKINSK